MDQPPLKVETYEIPPSNMNQPNIPYINYQQPYPPQQQMMNYGPMPAYNQAPIYQNPGVITITNMNLFASQPTYRMNQQIFCPTCKMNVVSNIDFEPGGGTWVACLLLGLCIGILGFIVFCIDDCKDCVHFCSRCGGYLGKVPFKM